MKTNRPAQSVTLALCLLAAAVSTGCATTERIADAAWTGTRNVAESAWHGIKTAHEKFIHYTRLADLLKKNHDSANHDEAEVMAIVRPKAAKNGSKGTASKSAPRSASRQTFCTVECAGKLGWPVEAGVVSSEFGPRWGREHKGIDIAGDVGEPILAAADGEVLYAGDGLRGYGNVVILRHDAKTTTLYAHNSALKVAVGERVKAGQAIALLGSTGHSTGPHCHFEIRVGSNAVDPRMRLGENQNLVLLADAGTKKASGRG